MLECGTQPNSTGTTTGVQPPTKQQPPTTHATPKVSSHPPSVPPPPPTWQPLQHSVQVRQPGVVQHQGGQLAQRADLWWRAAAQALSPQGGARSAAALHLQAAQLWHLLQQHPKGWGQRVFHVAVRAGLHNQPLHRRQLGGALTERIHAPAAGGQAQRFQAAGCRGKRRQQRCRIAIVLQAHVLQRERRARLGVPHVHHGSPAGKGLLGVICCTAIIVQGFNRAAPGHLQEGRGRYGKWSCRTAVE